MLCRASIFFLLIYELFCVFKLPSETKIWSLNYIFRRDFRLLMANSSNTRGDPVPQPNIWHAYDVTKVGDMKYSVTFDNPLDGHWRAFFIQVWIISFNFLFILQFCLSYNFVYLVNKFEKTLQTLSVTADYN